MGVVVRVALGVEYAGDGFEGWQSQAHGRTVQDVLEAAIARIAGHAVRLHCAGRTDAGVHASSQVTHFDTEARRSSNSWVRGVNNLLPHGVAVQWSMELDDRFHARYSACGRRYRYLLMDCPVRPAIWSRRVGWFHLPLDVERMHVAAQRLVGTHDFSAFRAAGCQAKSPVKIMHSATVRREGQLIVFDFHASAFLHHMVRNLVGALVYIGKQAESPEWIDLLLEQRDRQHAGATFSPYGLYLSGIDYPAHFQLPGNGRIIAQPCLPPT